MDSHDKSPRAKPAEKKTAYTRFANFLRKYRIAVLSVFGAAILALIAIAAFTFASDHALKSATAAMEKMEADYAAYDGEKDQAKKAELEKALLESADSVAKKWKSRFAAQRALSYKARIAETKKDWAEAEKDWLAVADAAPASYIAPVALRAAARAAEEQGAADRALAGYRKLVDKYASDAIGIPHAYFSIGRLSEGAKDYAGALTAYQKVVSTWPDSDWTKLATDRIISMKSQGLTK
jgi:tetratricopeptide (TPR) repeat protein